jgi:uncharacterized protein YecT (DUF1311 family)
MKAAKRDYSRHNGRGIKFRDADVDLYRDPNGGTAATLAGADRYLMMTAQRASELEKF